MGGFAIMTSKNEVLLTTQEISQLWGTYMGDSSQVCMMGYFLQVVEDEELRSILEFCYKRAIHHLEQIKLMLTGDGHGLPFGFNLEEDVEVTTESLFSDLYVLEYVHRFAQLGLRGHGVNLTLAVRKDCQLFFQECLSDSVTLYDRVKELLLKRQDYLFVAIPTTYQSSIVKDQRFLAGFFGDKRPLTAIEVTHLFSNFQRNALGAVMMQGFSQVAQIPEVKKYLIRGKEIGEKHCELFEMVLKQNNLSAKLNKDSQVLPLSRPLFSERLMMFIVSTLSSASLGFYGMGLGGGFRRDLGTLYSRLIMEVELFAEDGANLMIKHGLLEWPPIVKSLED